MYVHFYNYYTFKYLKLFNYTEDTGFIVINILKFVKSHFDAAIIIISCIACQYCCNFIININYITAWIKHTHFFNQTHHN